MSRLKSIRQTLMEMLEKEYYSGLSSQEAGELDEMLDVFYRKVKGLPRKPSGNPPYVGLGFSISNAEPIGGEGKVFSTRVINLIEEVEGYHTELPNGNCAAYLDPVGIPTIGFGTIGYEDGRKVKMGDVITRARAEELCVWELNKKILPALQKHPNYPMMSQSMVDAIGSFCYNLGSGGINHPKNFNSFYNLLRSPASWGDREVVEGVFLLYINAQGIRQTVENPHPDIEGLIDRRREEVDLWLEDFSVV